MTLSSVLRAGMREEFPQGIAFVYACVYVWSLYGLPRFVRKGEGVLTEGGEKGVPRKDGMGWVCWCPVWVFKKRDGGITHLINSPTK